MGKTGKYALWALGIVAVLVAATWAVFKYILEKPAPWASWFDPAFDAPKKAKSTEGNGNGGGGEIPRKALP